MQDAALSHHSTNFKLRYWILRRSMAHWQVAIRYMDMYRDDPIVHLAGVCVIAAPSMIWMVVKCPGLP
ncbi:hypothetical protein VTO73DRAFT_13857 [Trametes versicolor]